MSLNRFTYLKNKNKNIFEYERTPFIQNVNADFNININTNTNGINKSYKEKNFKMIIFLRIWKFCMEKILVKYSFKK